MFTWSCAQQQQANNGICKTGDGEINTYNPIAVWKKIPVTDHEKTNSTGSNYRLLYIVSGGASQVLDGGLINDIEVYYSNAICEEVHSNQDNVKTTKSGLYFLDDGRKRLRAAVVDVENGNSTPTENWVEYKFSGSCGSTIMTLTYKNDSGTVIKKEKYSYFSDKVPTDSCQPKQ